MPASVAICRDAWPSGLRGIGHSTGLVGRLAQALAIAEGWFKADILLLDEPTNHLYSPELIGSNAAPGCAVRLRGVSHDAISSKTFPPSG